MQEDREKRQVLLEFLDSKAFDPVLEAMPEQYSSERDRKMLEDVKKTIVTEKETFHKNDLTPEQVRQHFIREMYFETSGKLGKELEDLELPRLLQLREKFLQLCDELQL